MNMALAVIVGCLAIDAVVFCVLVRKHGWRGALETFRAWAACEEPRL